MLKLIKKFFEWGGIAPNEGGFIQAALMAAPYILQGISALGGVIGKKKKYMDPEMLRQQFGPQAIGKDTQALVNQILNSPYGQQLMASAAEQGQGLQGEMAKRSAAEGLSPDTGASSGASDFAVSAATQAQTGLERQTRAGIYQSAMPIAANMNEALMVNALANQGEQNATPSTWQRIAAAAGQTAATIPQRAPKPTGVPTTALTAAANMPQEMPALRPVQALAPVMPPISQPVQVPVMQRSLRGGNVRPAHQH